MYLSWTVALPPLGPSSSAALPWINQQTRRASPGPSDSSLPIEMHSMTILGQQITTLLLGVFLARAAEYAAAYPRDPRWLRASLLALVILNVAFWGTCLTKLIDVMGFQWGDWAFYDGFSVSALELANNMLSMSITLLCQAILSTRSFLFARAISSGTAGRGLSMGRLAFFVLQVSLSVLSTGAGVTGSVHLFKSYGLFSEMISDDNVDDLGKQLLPTLAMIWLLAGACADLCLCLSMSWDIWSARTGDAVSNRLMDSIILLFLRNGALLAALQITFCTLFFVKGSTWTDAIVLLLPRIASLTVLSSILSPREAYRTQQQKLELETSHTRCPQTSEDGLLAGCLVVRVSRRSVRNSRATREPRRGERSVAGGGIQVQVRSVVSVSVATSRADGPTGSTLHEQDLGTSCIAEGPATSIAHVATQARGHASRLAFVESFPARNPDVSRSLTGYDPDVEMEHDLPRISVEDSEAR